MNILFLTLYDFWSMQDRNIYTDLLREFARRGHGVFVVSPTERRHGKETTLVTEEQGTILKLKIGNVQKTGLLEKGISTVTLERTFIGGIKKYFGKVKFDLILYSTPPITLQKAVAFVKKRDHCLTYLLLKDIFPQNAVDIGMMTTKGPKALIYRFFRKKEKKLYALSDRIGCMSPANCEFLLRHNPEISPDRVEVCPNSVEITDQVCTEKERAAMREKYRLPLDKTIYVYGGNLGRPQGIPFMLECLDACRTHPDAFFLIVGDGTEFPLIERYVKEHPSANTALISRLPKEDYDRMIAVCDVGLIFLDYRFTIPNFPSRVLSYLSAHLPVIVCSDPACDMGRMAEDGRFGIGCPSNRSDAFCRAVDAYADRTRRTEDGARGFAFLCDHYSVAESVDIILRRHGAS